MLNNMAGYIYELDTDVFADVIPDTYQAFLDTIEKYDVESNSVALAMDCDDWSVIDGDLSHEAIEDIESACKQVCRAFEAKTGLKIALTIVESLSQYNEVNGPVWAVLNAIQFTKPAQAFEDFIDKKFFCMVG